MKRFHYINGYVLRYMPEHYRAFKEHKSGHQGYVYEHILVAEIIVGRKLEPKEIVHHLDLTRSNNSPENLLVINKDQHNKLHSWINLGLPILGKNRLHKTLVLIKKDEIKTHKERKIVSIRRCKICEFPLFGDQKETCSVKCNKKIIKLYKRKVKWPTKRKLKLLLKKYPWTTIGKKYKVSDNAVRKWAKSYGMDTKRVIRK